MNEDDTRTPAADRDRHGDDPCRDYVRLYLQAPFLADEARRTHGADHIVADTAYVVIPGLPASLQRALQEWAVDEKTPDEDVAEFIGWTVERVREHR